MTENQRKILDHIKLNPYAKVANIYQAIGISKSAVTTAIAVLYELKMIKHDDGVSGKTKDPSRQGKGWALSAENLEVGVDPFKDSCFFLYQKPRVREVVLSSRICRG